MTKLTQHFQVSFTYEVHFSTSVFNVDNTLLVDCLKHGGSGKKPKVLVVVDDGVVHHHPDLIACIKAYFNANDAFLHLVSTPIVLPGGEAAKNNEKGVENILQAISDFGIDRHAYVIGIGGGSVLDAVGFAAAIAHRGVRHVRIPTTVLAQNDAGIGVKNGINRFGKKNFIGCFDPPFAVINDSIFLTTLHDRDWRAGISEAIKVALIKDPDLFDYIQLHAKQLVARDAKIMQELIIKCAALHLEHISSGDPFEKGSSRPLDFGHWSAHKLEQLTNYSIRHGEAVAIGIALDCVYAYLIGMLREEELTQVIQLFLALGFTLFNPMLKIDDIKNHGNPHCLLAGLNEFREHLGGELTIMLIEGIGKGKEVHEINHEIMIKAVQELKTRSS